MADAGGQPSPKGEEGAMGTYTLKLLTDHVIGNGSFGVVFEAKIVETGETVAIKKVLQDKRFKNRELQIMKQLRHPNIVALRHYFLQNGSDKESDEVYLNLVLEFVPDTVYKVTRSYTKQRQLPPLIAVKLYVYQLARSLAYLHARGICHRDIKPQNLLVDARTHTLKLCDFGSAKALAPGEPSVAYICSRYYRAPELIFGATDYTTAIDIWSSGCVAAELLLGHPLFPGETGVDQLVEIIKVLGTPSQAQVDAMNPSYTEFTFPQIRPYPWAKIFRQRAPAEAVDLIARMVLYVPHERVTAIDVCAHPFFDELRDPSTRLPDGSPLPPLFNFTPEELAAADTAELREVLIPPHARNASNWPGPPLPPAAATAGKHTSVFAARAAFAGGGPASPADMGSARAPATSSATAPSAAVSARAPVPSTVDGSSSGAAASSSGAAGGAGVAGSADHSASSAASASASGAGAGSSTSGGSGSQQQREALAHAQLAAAAGAVLSRAAAGGGVPPQPPPPTLPATRGGGGTLAPVAAASGSGYR